MNLRRREYYRFQDFRSGTPTRVEEPIPPWILKTGLMISVDIAFTVLAPIHPVFAAGKIATAYNRKIWPLIIDIGIPFTKTMIALGMYKCIRSDTENGWKMIYRAALGLVGLYLIDGAIDILEGIGQDLQTGGH